MSEVISNPFQKKAKASVGSSIQEESVDLFGSMTNKSSNLFGNTDVKIENNTMLN